MSRGVWNTLDRLAGGQVPAAVLTEWRRLANGDFPLLGGFLRVTQRLAGDYPCLADLDCGCRHELVQCDDTRWVARCQCGARACAPAWLTPSDLIIHELDAAGFGRAAAWALGLGPPENAAMLYAAPKMWHVGTYAPTCSRVYLGLFPSEAELFDNVAGLVASRPEPFILLMPTAGLRSAAVDSFLARMHCGVVALSPCLAGGVGGSLRVTSPIEPALKRFAGDLAQGRNMGPMLEGIHREIAAVLHDRRDLTAEKARLEQIMAEGLLKFLGRIDAQALRVAYAVLAKGDIAKAARELEMKDSTLREFVAKWKGKGKDYAVLADLVRWRKETKFTGTVPLNEAVLASQTNNVDYGGLIADVLDGLLTMTEGNWEDKREELAELLRSLPA